MQLMVSYVTTHLGQPEREAIPIRPGMKGSRVAGDGGKSKGKSGVY